MTEILNTLNTDELYRRKALVFSTYISMADFRCAVIGTAFKPNYKCLFFTFTENTQPGNLESFIFQHVLCKYGSLFRSGESIGDRFGFILGR